MGDAPPRTGGPLRVGQDFGLRYRVQRLLGEGGMGFVYQALDRELNVPVALKVLCPPGGRPKTTPSIAEMQRRFKSELLLARQITHRNVIRIHDIGEVDGMKFISMPVVAGRDLASLVRGGPLPVPQAVRYARQIAAGLAAVHGAGVIHRDLKPSNIMIDAEDQAMLMDFGVARAAAPTGTQRATPGMVVGTAAYMAPEQTRGEVVDGRADIYAVGLVIYEMLAGAQRITLADVAARQKAAPEPVRRRNARVPAALDAIVSRCLQPDPAQRFPDAAALAAALDRLSRHGRGPLAAELLSPRALMRVAALLLVGILAGLAYWLFARGGAALVTASLTPAATAAARGVRDAAGLPWLRQAVWPAASAATTTTTDSVLPSLSASGSALADPGAARARLERLAATGPEGASRAASGLADLALAQGRPEAAAAILEPAIAADRRAGRHDRVAPKLLALADARAALGRPAAARAAIDEALAGTDGADHLLAAARQLVALGDVAGARRLAGRLAEQSEGPGAAYARLVDADVALAAGDTDTAIALLEQLLRETDLWLARFALGGAYLQAGRYDGALTELQMCSVRGREAPPDAPGGAPSLRYLALLQYLLARAHEGAGRSGDAAAHFTQFLALRDGVEDDPLARDARARLARLSPPGAL